MQSRHITTGWTILIALVALSPWKADAQINKQWKMLNERSSGFSLTLSPYRTYASLYMSLLPNPEGDVFPDEEIGFYKAIMTNSLLPDYVLLEATTFPFGTLDAYMVEDHNDLYNNFEPVRAGPNFLSAFAGGAQTPYSASVFLGDILTFYDIKDFESMEWVQVGRGIGGFVFTAGNVSIVDTGFVSDVWHRSEWKVKATRFIYGDEGRVHHKTTFEFSLGLRFHERSFIRDVILVTVGRNRTDPHYKGYSPLKNSLVKLKVEFPIKDLTTSDFISRYSLLYGKKFLFGENRKFQLILAGGLLWTKSLVFDPLIQKNVPGDGRFQLILKPSIKF